MLRTIIGAIIGLLVAVILVTLGFFAGANYGVQGTSKIICEGIVASVGTLDIGEASDELTLTGKNYGEYEGIKFVMVRTK